MLQRLFHVPLFVVNGREGEPALARFLAPLAEVLEGVVQRFLEMLEGLGVLEFLKVDVPHTGVDGSHGGILVVLRLGVDLKIFLVILQSLLGVACLFRLLGLGQQVLGDRGLIRFSRTLQGKILHVAVDPRGRQNHYRQDDPQRVAFLFFSHGVPPPDAWNSGFPKTCTA